MGFWEAPKRENEKGLGIPQHYMRMRRINSTSQTWQRLLGHSRACILVEIFGRRQ